MNKTAKIMTIAGAAVLASGLSLENITQENFRSLVSPKAVYAQSSESENLRQAKVYAKTVAETEIAKNNSIKKMAELMYSSTPVDQDGIDKNEAKILRKGGLALRDILRDSYEKAIKKYNISEEKNTTQVMKSLEDSNCHNNKARHVYDKANGYLISVGENLNNTKPEKSEEDKSLLSRVIPGSPENSIEIAGSYKSWKTDIMSGAHGGKTLSSETKEIPFSIEYIMNGEKTLHGIKIKTKLNDTETIEGETIREGKTPMGFEYTFMFKTPLALPEGMSLSVGGEAYWDTLKEKINEVVLDQQEYGINPMAALYLALGEIIPEKQKPEWLLKAKAKISPANWKSDEAADETYRNTSFESEAGIELNKIPYVDILCSAIYKKDNLGPSQPGAEGNSKGELILKPGLRFNIKKVDLGVGGIFNHKENTTTTGGWEKGLELKLKYRF